jgi:hypothetical protein
MEKSMFKMTLAAALALAAPAISTPARAQGAGIHIFASSYGLPGRTIEVTDAVSYECEGRYHCSFPVRSEFFGADPIFGVTKQVVVYWTCGGGGRNRTAYPEYTFARLSC